MSLAIRDASICPRHVYEWDEMEQGQVVRRETGRLKVGRECFIRHRQTLLQLGTRLRLTALLTELGNQLAVLPPEVLIL